MEKGNINVIIFDQDEPSVKDHRESRTVQSSKHMAHSSSHQLEIIQQEIQYLSEKIKGLEQQTEAVVQLKNESNVSCKHCPLGGETSPDHSKELLMVIEKKIQIVVRQTRKLVDKLGQSFEKKLESKLSKKYDEYGITKVKENYATTIKKIEQTYRKEIDKVNKQHKDTETRMLARVNAAEQKLISRINQIDTKEKEYVDWIHHLELQLKEQQQTKEVQVFKQQPLKEQYKQQPFKEQQQFKEQMQAQTQNRSKKMIEVTHAQPAAQKISKKDLLSQNSSVLTGDQNYSSLNPQKTNNNLNQNSKVHRRHRIFDPMDKSSSSVSPNSKIVSPLSVQPHPNQLSSKAINPLNKPRLTQNPTASPIEQPVVTGRMTEPLKSNYTVQVQSSPWKAIDKSIQKSCGQVTRRNQVVKEVNEDQFYKDLPKANHGWQKFQDYQENQSSSESEEDVIFYRSDEKHQEFGEMYKQNKWKPQQETKPIPNVFAQSKKQAFRPQQARPEQKVFSPFDL